MASGIGHYIHFQAANYLKHGIGDPKDSQGYRSRYQDLYEIREEIRTNSSYKGRGEKAWELEQKLNSFYSEPHTLPSGENYDDEMRKYLLNVIGDVTDNISLDISRLEANYNISDLYKQRGKGADKLMTDVLKQQSTIRVSTLSKNLRELGQVLTNLTKSPMMDKNSLLYSSELNKRYEKAAAAFNKVSYEIYRANGELRSEARMSTMGGGAGKTFSLDETKGKYAGIIKNFQEAYMELRQYMLQVQAMIQGKLGEYGIAGILAALECTTLEELKNVLGQLGKTSKSNSIAVTGDVGSRKVLLQSNLYIGTGGTEKEAKSFVDELNEAQSESEAKFAKYATEVDKDGNIVAATKSQDKVDLTFTFRDDDENYNLSIKNYNLDSHSTITLHKGNLLRLIQDYHVFINHLLNILPERTPQRGNNANLSGYATVAERILKELIAYKGLTGGVNAMMSDGSIQKTAEANQFVVNQRTKDKAEFKVYDIKSLMSTLLRDSDLINVNYTKKLNSIPNHYEEDEGKRDMSLAYKRARKMVIEFARIGITAEIKKEALR